MSPHSLRYPSPASGDVAEAGGRHRRPEEPAQPFRVSTLLEDDTWVPGPRSARHQRSARRSSTFTGGSSTGAGFSTGALSSPPARRSTAGRSAAHRAAPVRPPVTGSHRAPGTLPIESWLLMGKTRQQLLLASLVAVALLLIAVPGARGRDSIDAVNAAAARGTGNHAAQKAKGNGSNGGNDKQEGDAEAAKAIPAASAPAGDGRAPEATATATAIPGAKNTGPGNSLRTTGSSLVALTFDDGPDPAQTPKILALLAQYDVKATFCLVGRQAEKHPDIVRQIVAAGHTLCNHTWAHSLTIGKDKPEQIEADLAQTNAAIRAAVPDAKIPFFRAPGGNFTDRLVGVAGSAGMTSLYWQVDPADWDHKPGETDVAHTDRVVAEIKKHVRPGSIVLSHDFNQPDTIAAYQKLLPWLKANFALGIPGDPAPAETPSAPPATASPTPTETPATPDPSASASPATPAEPPAGAGAGEGPGKGKKAER
jgi:peptidoglycan/xylan/chitin deacetylase (PgdA/CDA1 family)